MLFCFYKYFSNNLLYLLISVCILSNIIAYFPFKTIFLGFGIILILMQLRSNGFLNIKFCYSHIAFLSAILASNIYNGTLNIKFLYLTCLLAVCSPLFFSRDNFYFKIGFLKCFFHVIFFLTIINFLCYFANINAAPFLLKDQAANYFSGITIQSMWLSALSGISAVASFYFFLSNVSKSYKLFYFLFFFISIFVTIVSASRIALIAALSTVFLLLVCYETKKNIFRLSFVIISVFIFSFPLLKDNLVGLQNKFKEDAYFGVNSRQKLWDARTREFQDSPIPGLGLSTRLVKGMPVTGRNESGSGWLSILAQTGLVGAVTFLFILGNMFGKFSRIKQYKELLLYYSVFIYLCIHSIAEGYILTPGYYLCFLFWILMDVITEFNFFKIDFKLSID